MKKFIQEYINIISYIIIGLVFSLAVFMLFLNFYHSKEVSIEYDRGDNYLSAKENYTQMLSQIRENINVYNQNQYKGSYDKFTLEKIKSKLSLCASSFESTKANDILGQKVIKIEDTYKLLGYYQGDIVNNCIVMQLYNLEADKIPSYNSIKGMMEFDSKMLIEQVDYVKKTMQFNSSYYFSSDFDKINVFNLNRDSFTSIESTYTKSLQYVLEVSNWYRKVVEGGI